MSEWNIPQEVLAEMQQEMSRSNQLLMALGDLEVRYAVEKNRLLQLVESSNKKQSQTVVAAAQQAGLNLDTERWVMDPSGTKLVKKEVDG